MKKIWISLLVLAACSHPTSEHMSSIQLLDRNGFSETISLQDRLAVYDKTDFLSPQPYQKVVRVYGKVSNGKTFSKITTYHTNGQLWKYLEIENGRAHGDYREWHPNGQLKISAFVIEGSPDVSEIGQMSWLFDGDSEVYDDKGNLIATIPYSKGLLEGISRYYFPSGELMKEIPYKKNEIHGTLQVFNKQGECLESIPYDKGQPEGLSTTYWSSEQLKAEEFYENGLLTQAQYLNKQGETVAQIDNGFGKQALFQEDFLFSLLEYKNGKVDGEVQIFNSNGCLTNLYSFKDGMKMGEEWEYYPTTDGIRHPKLFLEWDQDTIQGVTKTWFENGILQSQREMHNNKKHGLSFAWFKEGDLMLMEEYEDDVLLKGSYYRKWEKTPISKVENGKGVATLFDKDGRLIRKITYEKGLPLNEG
jgi:antitoxin component YwqK of YwqJK toxin-antitoxin module